MTGTSLVTEKGPLIPGTYFLRARGKFPQMKLKQKCLYYLFKINHVHKERRKNDSEGLTVQTVVV